MSNRHDDTILWFFVLAVIGLIIFLMLPRRRGFATAFGTAFWMTDALLRTCGMLAGKGLVLGRTAAGALIRIPNYCAVLLVGGTGSGKGIGIIIPTCLDYRRGSLIVWDTKGDLFSATAELRQKWGEKVVRLAPFNGGGDSWNMLDTILADSPLLTEGAGAMAEALVLKDDAKDPHWNARAVTVIKAVLIFVLIKLKGEDRSLNSVRDIVSNFLMLHTVAENLMAVDKEGKYVMGRVAAGLGSQVKALFDETWTRDKEGKDVRRVALSKEGNGVYSTVCRHLSWLESDLVARNVATSTFRVESLLEHGTTLFLQIPGDQLEAAKGLFRCWVSTLIRVISSSGSEEKGEVLFLLDECSSLNNLSALEEALVRGRSAGCRFILAYQSISQIETAFEGKKSLLLDNCAAQIWLMPPSSYDTAERVSKMCGDYTQWVNGEGANWGRSQSSSSEGSSSNQVSTGGSVNMAQQGRALKRPEEILCLPDDTVIAFVRGLPGPIFAQRISWFSDPDFNPDVPVRPRPSGWPLLRGTCLVLIVWIILIVLAAMIESGH